MPAHRTRAPRSLLVLSALLVAGFHPAVASAATVSVSVLPFGTEISYLADPGETNDLQVTIAGGSFTFTDSGAAVVAGAGCVQNGPNEASCSPMSPGSLIVVLDDLDDKMTSTGAVPAQPAFVGSVSAGDGDDTIDTTATPYLSAAGGAGNDLIDSGPGYGTLDGGDGNDVIHGGQIDGPGSGSFIHGGAGNDTIIGGAGPDLIDGGDGNDTIEAGAGDDSVLESVTTDVANDDAIDAGPGNDFVEAGNGDDGVTGADGNDSLVGLEGNDTLDAGAGDDELLGGSGDDSLAGGEGNDRLAFAASSRLGFEFGPDLGTDSVDGGPGDDVISGGPDATGSAAGESGADVFDGGPGTDTADYSARTTSVVLTLDGEPNDGRPGEGDRLLAVEGLRGGSDSDALTGDAGVNTLDGGPGDDQLTGGDAGDTLLGGLNDAGSDSLDGGAGDDSLNGGAGDDSLDGAAGTDTLGGAGGSDAVTGGDGDDTLAGGPGIDSVEGGAGDDRLLGGDVALIGADGADMLSGGEGDDALDGGPGGDTLDGGLGADGLVGGLGRDVATYGVRASPVSVTLDGNANDGEAGENDNVAADVESVEGGATADDLVGNRDPNALDGGSGQDFVDGSPGADSITGGTGADVVRGRDGSADVVSCGDEEDFAIADSRDILRDCEFADRGGPRRPVFGRYTVAQPRRGKLGFQPPAMSRQVPLQDQLKLPVGSTLDARRGTVRLTAPGASADFSGGRFTVTQNRRSRTKLTELRMVGGNFGVCRRRGARAAQRARTRVRRLFGRGRGRFRASGRHSSATVRGTAWTIEDRCDGTLTIVRSGRVSVFDFTTKETVTVSAGHRYLARASR